MRNGVRTVHVSETLYSGTPFMTFVGSWDLRILINNHTWPRDWMKKGDNYDSFLASSVLFWFLNSQWVMLNATTDTFLKHEAS